MTIIGDNGYCAICHKHDYLTPLHGDQGGPLCCLLCKGQWHGEHGRRRRLGRIVIRALAAYYDGGGKWADVAKLQLSATIGNPFAHALGLDFDPLGYLADTAGTAGETVDLTSELLTDAIKIAHPDLHPPERRELAQRVTQGLLALQPFVFPATKPKADFAPTPRSEQRNGSMEGEQRPEVKPLRFPCKDCADTTPGYYCAPCRAEQEKRWQTEREQESAKRRAQYAARKARREHRKPPTICACGNSFKGRRKDARFCSDACRQRAHRKSVTAKTTPPRRHSI